MLYGKLHIIVFAIVVVVFMQLWQTLLPLLLYLLWLLYLFIKRSISFLIFILAVSMLCTTYLYFPAIEYDVQREEASSEDKDISHVTGKIYSHIVENDLKIEFTLKTNENHKILITYFKDKPSEKQNENFNLYASCTISGQKNMPPSSTNPHQFNYLTFLLQKGIHTQLTVNKIEDIRCKKTSQSLDTFKVRDHLIKYVQRKFPKETGHWMMSLVLGDDSQLESDIIDVFQRWGISHLLAISGLHVGIIVAIVYFSIIYFNLITKEQTNLILILFLGFYAWIAGGQPSVLRASMMVIIGLLFLRSNRHVSMIDVLSITFFILFMIDPYFIYQIGFQLSFAVTFAIIISRKWLQQSSSVIMTLFKLSFISQMSIIPFQIHYFSIFEPLSILLNLIIVPYFSFFVIPFLFLLLLLSFLPFQLLQLLTNLFEIIQHLVLDVLLLLDDFLYYPFVLKSMTVGEIAIYYLILYLFMLALEQNTFKKSVYYGFCFALLLPILSVKPYFNPYGTLTILDIGQGDAIVLELPYRKGVFLIDVGAIPSFYNNDQNKKTYDNIIKPFLRGEGIMKINGVFLSHDDFDHYGSLPYLLEDYTVQQVFTSEYFDQSLFEGTNIPFMTLKKGAKVSHGNSDFNILHPKTDMGNENDNSLVIHMKLGGLYWLFTGDISESVENMLIEDNENLKIDALKVAHHGSKTSSSEKIIEAVRQFSIIPVGRNNRYGHPHQDVIRGFNENNIKVFRTDEDGAIQFKFLNNKFEILTFIHNKK